MLRYPRCIAPVLLASFVGVIATGAAARAEPASAAPAADADCLTKPDAQTAPGNHWYYRLDRASGRRCWYQRPASGAQGSAQNSVAGQTRSVPARAAVPPPAESAASEGAADSANDTRDRAGAAPVTAAPAPLYSWPTAAPAPVPPEQMMAPASDVAAPAPAASPQPATADEPASAAPPSRAPIRAATIERPAAPVEVEEGTHLPALLGAALALLIVVLGSIVARITASVIRSRRRDRALDAMAPPIYPARDAPGLVPIMPRERDITRKTRMRRTPTEMPAAREDGAQDSAQDSANVSGAAAARIRDETRALEQNVRDLLRRLNSDLLREPRSPAAPAAPQPPSEQELDQALAAWRGRGRRRKPG